MLNITRIEAGKSADSGKTAGKPGLQIWAWISTGFCPYSMSIIGEEGSNDRLNGFVCFNPLKMMGIVEDENGEHRRQLINYIK
jgi:hypothetical protein